MTSLLPSHLAFLLGVSERRHRELCFCKYEIMSGGEEVRPHWQYFKDFTDLQCILHNSTLAYSKVQLPLSLFLFSLHVSLLIK